MRQNFAAFQQYKLDSYIVFYTCKYLIESNIERYIQRDNQAWILSRRVSLEEDVLEEIEKELLSLGNINKFRLSRTSYDQCN